MANGYYTANDVREIIAYAKARHITVVPEIDLPGHSAAAIFAYPELCCFPEEIYSRNRDAYRFNYSKFTGIYCFGNPNTIRFLEKVFDYVCELFPSEVIHIGGDECFRSNWKKCPKCHAFMKREGLKGVEQIQPWVTRHFTEYLAKKGRRVIISVGCFRLREYISLIRSLALRSRRVRMSSADSAAIGRRTLPAALTSNGNSGRAASRSRKSSGRIQTRPSATSRSSPCAPPNTAAGLSAHTSTAPR